MRLGRTALQTWTFARAARRYWINVFPQTRRELRHWKNRAAAIPDPELRRDALFTHRTKSRNTEGLAAFAILSPGNRRQELLPGVVAFEGILDYLDTISELPVEDPLANGLQLHRAFEVAVDTSISHQDYYAFHPQKDDGGYLAAHAQACREVLKEMPSYPVARDALLRCARRTGQAQSFSHATALGLDERRIIEWADATAEEISLGPEMEWWEMVGAGSSTLPVGVLMAAASDPTVSTDEIALIEAAYFPWVGALNTLLDCLTDFAEDPAGANHLNRYASEEEAVQRLTLIASRSLELVSELPNAELHKAILGGVGGYYLAHSSAWTPGCERIARGVLESLGEFARPALIVHCIREGRPRFGLRVATS